MESTHTSKMIHAILTEDEENIYGCKAPIALIKTDHRTWTFTNSNKKIIDSEEVIFGLSPEEMIAKLEIYIGCSHPRLQSIHNYSWAHKYRHISVNEHPIFTVEWVTDIALLMPLVDEYGAICASVNNAKLYQEVRQMLALNGYFMSGSSNIVKKDPKQAKAFLWRLKAKKKEFESTFWVRDIHECMYNIYTYLPNFYQFKINTVIKFISLLCMFEGVYGVNSRYRLLPFRDMIRKWRISKKKSHAFKKEPFAKFVRWLDREAALPDNTEGPIIPIISLDDFVAQLPRNIPKKRGRK